MNKRTIRYQSIVAILRKRGEVSTRQLAEILHTSEMTIRRDLNYLEEQGLIVRKYGGAYLTDRFPGDEEGSAYSWYFGKEIGVNVREKSLVGRQAVSLIRPNETVAFDMGTTTHFIAHYLSRELALNAICISYDCFAELYNKPLVQIILPGGQLLRETNSFYSEEGIELLKKKRTDKVFISTGGIHKDLGLTVHYDYQVKLKRILMESSKQVILVSDSSKIDKVTPVHFAELKEINTFITDDGIPNDYADFVRALGIELMICGKQGESH